MGGGRWCRVFVDDGFLHSGEAVGGGLGGVFAPLVQRLGGGDGDDFSAGGVVQPGGGDDGFEPDAAVGIGGGFFQQGGVIGDAMGVVAKDADRGGAGVVVLRVEQLAEQRLVHFIQTPGGPERFEQVVLVAGIFLDRAWRSRL